jgi:hypothetical protein
MRCNKNIALHKNIINRARRREPGEAADLGSAAV